MSPIIPPFVSFLLISFNIVRVEQRRNFILAIIIINGPLDVLESHKVIPLKRSVASHI